MNRFSDRLLHLFNILRANKRNSNVDESQEECSHNYSEKSSKAITFNAGLFQNEFISLVWLLIQHHLRTHTS